MAFNANQQSVVDLFIAAYGRAPTQAGLDFFTGKLDSGEMSLKDISNYMFDTANNPEAATRYPDSGTLEDKVNTVFNHVLGRGVATEEGMDFWKSKFDNPDYTMKDLVFDVLQEAKNNSDDNHTLENKSAVVEYFLTKVPADQQAGNQISTDTVTDDASVTSADAAIDAIVAGDSVIELTANPDNLTGNVFHAGRVWDPSGDDQLNSLNDDDVLTGTGDNPTLNVDFINDVDSGDMDIMPTLNNIETVNVKFSANAAQTIDFQDTTGLKHVNAERIDGGANVTFDNIQSVLETASVKNSNDNITSNIVFDHNASVLSGTSDEVALTLSNVQMNGLRIDGGANEGYETLNLTSTGSSNILNILTDEDIQTLNIEGDQNLTIGGEGNATGSLTTVEASKLTGDFDFRISKGVINAAPDGTSSGDVAFSLTSGTGNDTVRVSDQIGATDKIELGEGSDKLIVEAVDALSNYTAKGTTITGVEAVELLNSDPDNAVIGFLADEADGDQTFLLRNDTDGAGNNTTYNVMNLSEVEATQITIEHSGDKVTNPALASNGLNDNIVNLDVADGVTAAAITIGEGVNTDPGFNFQLYTDSDLSINNTTGVLDPIAPIDNETNSVTSLTINDNDSESNTLELLAQSLDKDGNGRGQATAYTDTITVTGGKDGKFLNLDATANIYSVDTTGTLNDSASGVVVNADKKIESAERLVVKTFDASTSKSDIVARFSTNVSDENGGQNITTGEGDDTVIFDFIGDNRAGLTISDSVNAGNGNDTLVIDGDLSNMDESSAIKLSDSEWTNVSNFENIRLINDGIAKDGNANSYDITLTDSLISSNHDDKGLLNIINDNGDATATTNSSAQSAVVIRANTLSDTSHFSYNGEEGANSTNDRIIVSDKNMNGKNIIDGGSSIDTNKTTNDGANGDVLEVRNASVVTIGDLDNIKNIGTLEFSNDQSVTQHSTLELNDDVVDSLIDSYHTSISRTSVNPAPAPEKLYINVVDSEAIIATSTATTALTLDASKLTNRSDLDILLGRGDNDIQVGAGNDNVILLGNYAENTYSTVHTANGAEASVDLNKYYTLDTATNRAVTDKIDLGTGDDTLTTYGKIDLTGATLTGIEHFVAHSDVVITESQYQAFSSITFDGANAHSLTIVDDSTGVAESIDLSKLTLAQDSANLEVSISDGGNTSFINEPIDSSDNGDISVSGFTLKADKDSVNEGESVTYTLKTTDIADGTELGYTLQGSNITADDFDNGSVSGKVVVKNNEATIKVDVKADQTTEGEESLTLALDNGKAQTTIVINDTSLTPEAGARTTVDVDAKNNGDTTDVSKGDFTFNFAEATYEYTVNGLNAGDVLNLPDAPAPTVNNSDYNDNSVDLQWAANGQVVTVHVTGLADGQDSQLNSVADFDTLFGAGTIA